MRRSKREKGQEGEPDGPGLWHRWQKNRYDVFMRMAQVCQADGEAIAARRISEEKHEIVAPLARREARPDLFSITFLRLRSGYSRFPTRLPLVSHSCLPSSALSTSRPLSCPRAPPPRNKIRFDVNLSTDISSQRGGGPSFSFFHPSPPSYRRRSSVGSPRIEAEGMPMHEFRL